MWCRGILLFPGRKASSPLVDYAIADSVTCKSPYRCAVSSSPAAEGCFARQVREWSSAVGLLIKTRAIVSVSGCIRPPYASAHAISPSAASSLLPVAAPACFSLQCRCRKSWWQGLLKGLVSRHLVVSRQEASSLWWTMPSQILCLAEVLTDVL